MPRKSGRIVRPATGLLPAGSLAIPYAVEHLLLQLALRIATQVKRQSPANLTAVASRADYQ
jgi:hypothetical protein